MTTPLKKTYRAYDTIATFKVEEIVPLIQQALAEGLVKKKIGIDWFHPDIHFRILETRLIPFASSTVCYGCGRAGTFFALQRGKNKEGEPRGDWHINLYAPIGHMITCDHLVPKSGGGTDNPSNLGTLCSSCNSKKGSLSRDEFLDLRRRSMSPKEFLALEVCGYSKSEISHANQDDRPPRGFEG